MDLKCKQISGYCQGIYPDSMMKGSKAVDANLALISTLIKRTMFAQNVEDQSLNTIFDHCQNWPLIWVY